jgi:hypothetical protein
VAIAEQTLKTTCLCGDSFEELFQSKKVGKKSGIIGNQ